MINQVILVGRLVDNPVLYETENGKTVTTITLAVNRSFKNSNGTYDTDFIRCTLWQGLAQSTSEFCEKGSTIGIKGRLASRSVKIDHLPDDEKTPIETPFTLKMMEVIAEKITFISPKKN